MGASANTLLQLLPRGAAWPRSLTSALGVLLSVLGEEFDRVEERARQLLLESLPSSVVETIDEWAVLTRSREITAGSYPLGSIGIRPVVVARLESSVLSPARIRRFCQIWNNSTTVGPIVNFVRVDRIATHEVTILLELGSESLEFGFQEQLRALAQIHGTINVDSRPHTDELTLRLEHDDEPLQLEHEYEALTIETTVRPAYDANTLRLEHDNDPLELEHVFESLNVEESP